MVSLGGGVSNSILHLRGKTHFPVLAALVSLAIVAGLAAFAMIGHQPAYAAGPDGTANSLPGCVGINNSTKPAKGTDNFQLDRDPRVISPIDPAIVGEMAGLHDGTPLPQQLEPAPQREVYVWAACLTVEEHSDSSETYLGYMPGLSPSKGALYSPRFTYRDMDYRIRNLYHHEADTGDRQLVLESNIPLPDKLTLYLGKDEFPLSTSEPFGKGPNVRVWRLDDSLDWTQDQAVLVLLRESYGLPMSKAGSAAVGYPHLEAVALPSGLQESEATGTH